MNPLKIAYTEESKEYFLTHREMVLASDTDYTDVAAAVLTDANTNVMNDLDNTKFGIPIFVVLKIPDRLDDVLAKKAYQIIDSAHLNVSNISNDIEKAAK